MTTKAFEDGYAHAMNKGGISGRFAYKGAERGFWEAGHLKGANARKAADAAAAPARAIKNAAAEAMAYWVYMRDWALAQAKKHTAPAAREN